MSSFVFLTQLEHLFMLRKLKIKICIHLILDFYAALVFYILYSHPEFGPYLTYSRPSTS